MDYSKEELEKLIAEKFSVGKFTFNTENKCFFNETEIFIGIVKVSENKYKDSERYFYDGYEVYLQENEIKEYIGNKEIAKSKAIECFNRKKFLGYPIICTNLTCDVI